jgi:hypothetical protein
MPELTFDKDGKITGVKTAANFDPSVINLKDYFQIAGVNKNFADDVKVVYTVKKLNAVLSPMWDSEVVYDFTEDGYGTQVIATLNNNSVGTTDGVVLNDAILTWAPMPLSLGNSIMAKYCAVDRVEVSAYLVQANETATTDEALAKVAYDKETITIVQKDRISSFTQIANTGDVTYKNGENKVNIMSFIETKDFNGYVLSNTKATSVANYWYPAGYTAAEGASVAKLYGLDLGMQFVFGDPSCELKTAQVAIANDGTLTFTTNSADLLSDVVVTVPVYLTYDYDNFGSTAKKVDVKVTFKPGVADDTTPEGGNTTPEGDDNTGGKTDADYVGDDDMFVE